jgi:hypothetical protein
MLANRNIDDIIIKVNRNKNIVNNLYSTLEKSRFFAIFKEIIKIHPICITILQKFINNNLTIDHDFNVSEETPNGKKILKIHDNILYDLIEKNGEISTFIDFTEMSNEVKKEIIRRSIVNNSEYLLYYKNTINNEDYFDLALEAVKNDGTIIYYIELNLLSDEQKCLIASEAIKQNYKSISSIKKIYPKKMADYIIEMNTTEYVNDIDICTICDEKISNVITECNHQFCKECIYLWFGYGTGCPYCRQNINKDSIKNLKIKNDQIDVQIDIQTNNQTDNQIDVQIDNQIDVQIDNQIDIQTDNQT